MFYTTNKRFADRRGVFLLIVAMLTFTTNWSCAADEPKQLSTRPASRPATAATTSRATLSPLINALVEYKPVSVILDMIAAGEDVNARDLEGRSTALYYAAARVDYDGSMLPVVKAMVERGADVRARCIGGCTALDAACESSSLAVIDYLISKGADVNWKDDDGATPLHSAAHRDPRYPREERMRIIRRLVNHGAEINATTKRGETPRDWALKVTEDPSADILLGELGGKYGGSPPGSRKDDI
jgi:hypothetical protein